MLLFLKSNSNCRSETITVTVTFGDSLCFRLRQLMVQVTLLSDNPRPTIDSISSETIGYGENFEIDFSSADAINKVAIIRCSSITHGFNFDQRYVDLNFSIDATTLTCVSPPNGAIAPPGMYMLFIISQNNISSEGKFMTIGI